MNTIRCVVALFCLVSITVSIITVKETDMLRNFTMCNVAKTEPSFKSCVKVFVNEEQMLGELFARKFATLLQMNESYFPQGSILHVNVNGEEITDDIKRQYFIGRSYLWIILEDYYDNVKDAFLPALFIPKDHRPKYANIKEQIYKAEENQWTDLIIFDYLISNVDRVASHCINQRWNTQIYRFPISNLGITPNGTFLLFDNDAAFFQGYRILHKYQDCQSQILQQIRFCSTIIVNNLRKLNNYSSVRLLVLIQDASPMQIRNKVSDINHKFLLHHVDILKERISDTLASCQYNRSMQ